MYVKLSKTQPGIDRRNLYLCLVGKASRDHEVIIDLSKNLRTALANR
jgi:hypothetical protein